MELCTVLYMGGGARTGWQPSHYFMLYIYASVAIHSVMRLLNESNRLLFRFQRPTIISFNLEHSEIGGGFFVLP